MRLPAAGAKHFRIVKFELIRLYEIQHDLRQLSYFDVFGRLRLSLQLARVTLSIPMAIDKAMREDDEYNYDGSTGYVDEGDADLRKNVQVVKRGLLGPRIASVLGLAGRMPLSLYWSGRANVVSTGRCSAREGRAHHVKTSIHRSQYSNSSNTHHRNASLTPGSKQGRRTHANPL